MIIMALYGTVWHWMALYGTVWHLKFWSLFGASETMTPFHTLDPTVTLSHSHGAEHGSVSLAHGKVIYLRITAG